MSFMNSAIHSGVEILLIQELCNTKREGGVVHTEGQDIDQGWWYTLL